jgi:membrane fusion protein, multidrug efflux system
MASEPPATSTLPEAPASAAPATGSPHSLGGDHDPSRRPPGVLGCVAISALLAVGSFVGINHLKASKESASDGGASKAGWSQKGASGEARGAKGSAEGGREGKGARGGAEARPVAVTVFTAERKTVPVDLRVVGNALPFKTVSVVSQVSGPLTHVYFKQGDYVKRGQPLFEVDPRPLQATLDQVSAQLDQAQAQVAQAQANVAKDRAVLAQTQRTLAKDRALIRQAESNLAKDKAQQSYARKEDSRYTGLLKEGYVTAEQAEQQTATARSYDATVEADRASLSSVQASMEADAANIAIQQAALHADEAAVNNALATVRNLQAAVRNAEVQLGYTRIASPLDGRTGALTYYEGNVVRANDTTPLVTISQIAPIYINFSVPEQYLTEIRTLQKAGPLRVTAVSQDDNTAPSGTSHPDQPSAANTSPAAHPLSKPVSGVVDFIDNTVDTTTGTILVRGTFDNHDRSLWPGHFVNVSLRLKQESDKVVIPLQAVQPGQKGDYVFVVKDDQTVDVRTIKVERSSGNDAILASGLEVGETVVLDGQLLLTPGKQVKVITPGADDTEHGPTSQGRGNEASKQGSHRHQQP